LHAPHVNVGGKKSEVTCQVLHEFGLGKAVLRLCCANA